MRSIEASGKTVKDAVDNGLETLGCDRDDVEIQVLQMNTTGLFGMFAKPAKVLLTVKDKDAALDIEMPKLSLDGGRKPKSEKKPKPQKVEKPAEAPKVEAPAEDEGAQAEEGPKPEKKSRNRRRRRGGSGSGNAENAPREKAAESDEETVVPAPVLYDYGVDCMAGSVITDPERAKSAVMHAATSGIFKHGVQKMRVERPGWLA